MLDSLKTKAAHLLSGSNAEDRAYDYLINNGLKPVCRNYRCKHGELDLVMKDQHVLVIIEVRYRKSDVYGSALESITTSKQARIIATTQHYLATQRTDYQLRFDVIAISGNHEITWIKNAF